MSIALLLLPDLALILLGLLLRRASGLRTEFWAGAEKLTYFVLFPALLFVSNARGALKLGDAAPMLATALAVVSVGIVLGLVGKMLFRPPRHVFGAGFQCAFRFNSYIALALANRLEGDTGLALMALTIGVTVPLVNVVSVWGLARGSTHGVWREIASNPLIISSLAGIGYGALAIPLPDVVNITCTRLGAAALVLGLLAVGAALDITPPREARGWFAWLMVVKLIALPAIAWAIGSAIALPASVFAITLAFAALPPASAAYILAVRLGGDGRFVATLVSYCVAASLLTLPFWLGLLNR